MSGSSTFQWLIMSEGLGFFLQDPSHCSEQYYCRALMVCHSVLSSWFLVSNTCFGHGLTGPCASHWGWTGNPHCRLTAGKRSPSAKQATWHLHPCSHSCSLGTQKTANEAWRYTGTHWEENIIGRESEFLHFCSCFQTSSKLTLGSLAKMNEAEEIRKLCKSTLLLSMS